MGVTGQTLKPAVAVSRVMLNSNVGGRFVEFNLFNTIMLYVHTHKENNFKKAPPFFIYFILLFIYLFIFYFLSNRLIQNYMQSIDIHAFGSTTEKRVCRMTMITMIKKKKKNLAGTTWSLSCRGDRATQYSAFF